MSNRLGGILLYPRDYFSAIIESLMFARVSAFVFEMSLRKMCLCVCVSSVPVYLCVSCVCLCSVVCGLT